MNSADLQLAAASALERCSVCKLPGEIAITKMVESESGARRAHRTCRTCLGFPADPVRVAAERQIIGRADDKRLAPKTLDNARLEWDGSTPVRRAA